MQHIICGRNEHTEDQSYKKKKNCERDCIIYCFVPYLNTLRRKRTEKQKQFTSKNNNNNKYIRFLFNMQISERIQNLKKKKENNLNS